MPPSLADTSRSVGRSEWVGELYEQRGIPGVVFERSLSLGNGTDGQLACFRQCFDRYKHDTDWFAAIVRAPPPASLTAQLNTMLWSLTCPSESNQVTAVSQHLLKKAPHDMTCKTFLVTPAYVARGGLAKWAPGPASPGLLSFSHPSLHAASHVVSYCSHRCCLQDVDEFLWAPSHRRLVDYLAAQPDDVSEIIGLVGHAAYCALFAISCL